MTFEDRLRAASAEERARRQAEATAAASEQVETATAREAARRLLPDVDRAARAVAALPPWPVPDGLDPDGYVRAHRMVYEKNRDLPVPHERKVADPARPGDRPLALPFVVHARFESVRQGFRGKRWEHRFVGWRMDLGSGARAEVDAATGQVRFLVQVPAGGAAIRTADELAETGIERWAEARGKEWSAPARSVRAPDVLDGFVDHAARLVAAVS